jgi:flagellar hook-length control protein FliK
MNMTLKTMPNPSPAAATGAVSPAKATSPAAGATNAASTQTGSAETSPTPATEQDAFARALQIQLDKQPAVPALLVTSEDTVQSESAPESATATPVDLGALLSGLQVAPALVQASPATPDTCAKPEPAKPEGTTPMLPLESRPAALLATLESGKPARNDEKVEPFHLPGAAKDEAEKPAVTSEMVAALRAPQSSHADTPATEARADSSPLAHVPTLGTAHARAEEARPVSVPALRVETPFAASGWQDELGQKLSLLVGREQHRAEIILNPPHLGRLEVSLQVNNDQASALFVSANPVVRDALEQALPRLREALADAGVALGQASVGAQTPREGQDSRGSGKPGFRSASQASPAAPVWLRRAEGLVDTFV